MNEHNKQIWSSIIQCEIYKALPKDIETMYEFTQDGFLMFANGFKTSLTEKFVYKYLVPYIKTADKHWIDSFAKHVSKAFHDRLKNKSYNCLACKVEIDANLFCIVRYGGLCE